MATRRDAREWAVQLLFELDLNPGNLTERLHSQLEKHSPDKRTWEFAEDLVKGVAGLRDALDEVITRYAQNWEIHRMAVVDRNVLRLALYEILFRPDIPAAVSINEAVDLANYFNSAESGKFVNGILDRVRKDAEAGILSISREQHDESSAKA